MSRLDLQVIRQQIANLLLVYPELAEDEVLRADMIEGGTEAFDFLTQIVRLIEDARALSDGTSERLKDLQARRDRFGRRIEAYRSLAFKIMQAANIKKAEMPEATLSIRNGSPKVIITDEATIHTALCRTKHEPDKSLIKDALEFFPVDGAALSNAEPTIAFRVK